MGQRRMVKEEEVVVVSFSSPTPPSAGAVGYTKVGARSVLLGDGGQGSPRTKLHGAHHHGGPPAQGVHAILSSFRARGTLKNMY